MPQQSMSAADVMNVPPLVNLRMNLNETDESMNESLPLQGTQNQSLPIPGQEKDPPFHPSSFIFYPSLLIKLFMLSPLSH